MRLLLVVVAVLATRRIHDDDLISALSAQLQLQLTQQEEQELRTTPTTTTQQATTRQTAREEVDNGDEDRLRSNNNKSSSNLETQFIFPRRGEVRIYDGGGTIEDLYQDPLPPSPDDDDDDEDGNAIGGILFLAHGCGGKITDYWDDSDLYDNGINSSSSCPGCNGLPEQVAIVKMAISPPFRFKVVAAQAERKCWNKKSARRVVTVLRHVVLEETRKLQGKRRRRAMPVYALGASSGGYLVSRFLPDALERQRRKQYEAFGKTSGNNNQTSSPVHIVLPQISGYVSIASSPPPILQGRRQGDGGGGYNSSNETGQLKSSHHHYADMTSTYVSAVNDRFYDKRVLKAVDIQQYKKMKGELDDSRMIDDDTTGNVTVVINNRATVLEVPSLSSIPTVKNLMHVQNEPLRLYPRFFSERIGFHKIGVALSEAMFDALRNCCKDGTTNDNNDKSAEQRTTLIGEDGYLTRNPRSVNWTAAVRPLLDEGRQKVLRPSPPLPIFVDRALGDDPENSPFAQVLDGVRECLQYLVDHTQT